VSANFGGLPARQVATEDGSHLREAGAIIAKLRLAVINGRATSVPFTTVSSGHIRIPTDTPLCA
jgi:hypothetical protein